VAFLDHVYGVVDEETAAAVADSDFLPRFGRFEVATVVADNQSWTGRYLFGRRTYVELFGPGDLSESGNSEASAGLGLSTHDRGGLRVVSERMAGWGRSSRTGRQTREADVAQVPWFDYLEPTEAPATFEAWVMEFLEEPSDLEIREAAFVDWMAGSGESVPSQGLQRGSAISDVSLVRLSMSADGITATGPMLRAAGFQTVSTPGLVVAQDAETTIELHATTGSAELQRVEFVLASPGVEHVETIGGSRLTVGTNGRAVWDFTSS
jgi:hypothetical protein